MLSHLLITNYALIDKLEIDFNQGFTIITGETGAGKSIILGALSLILGERVDAKTIRRCDKKSVIEATFDISNYNEINPFLDENEIETYDVECILRREISPNGRSRAFINDTPVTLTLLRELTLKLVDIHSQHSNILLGNSNYQLQIIDSVSENIDLKNEYSRVYFAYKGIRDKLRSLKDAYEKSRHDEDYIRYQLAQIAELKLKENEDEELECEQERLSKVEDIKQCLWSAVSCIEDDENSVISSLSYVAKGFSKVENVDNHLKEISERLESLLIELKDLGQTVNSLQDLYVDNPQELERISGRLNAIYDLENKHKVNSVNELIKLQHSYEEKLALIDNSDEEIKLLEKDLLKKEQQAMEIAQRLSDSRKQGIKQFIEMLRTTAIPLGLSNLRFEVALKPISLSATGIDKVKFLFAFNKQQQLMPIEDTASGGELSRVMLSIKTIVAQKMQLPTIIFDEVDTGVSGEIAHKMGEMMNEISQKIQVIAITHLPQVAVKGNSHFKVFKSDNEDSTITSMYKLTRENRITEIAKMLSGKEVDEAAINNAKSLLGY